MPQFLGVPDVVWSGVIASGITLFGVWLSNRSNSERLGIQLNSDAKEKAKQRKAELRKSVYLEFVEEMVKANIALSTLPNVDVTKVNPAEGVAGFNAAAAKLQLISEIETADSVADIQVKFAALFMRAMAKLQNIQIIKSQIAIHNDLYEASNSEVKRILAAMTAFNEAARKEQDVFEALSRSFEFQRDLAAEHAQKRDEFWKERNALHMDFIRFITEEVAGIRDEMARVQILIRSELELEEDRAYVEERMRARAIENQKAIQATLEETFSSLTKTYPPVAGSSDRSEFVG